tara:strand:- start:101 stop:499 length:399 start_codon:yes stop_codon:yes gene_type:complete
MAEATGTTTEVIRQAPFIEEYQRALLEQGFARGETPFSEETFDKLDTKVAGLDPLTQQAMQTGAGIGQYMPYLQQAADTTGQGIDYLRAKAKRFQVILTKLELKLPAAIKCLTLLAQQPIKTRMKIKWFSKC